MYHAHQDNTAGFAGNDRNAGFVAGVVTGAIVGAGIALLKLVDAAAQEARQVWGQRYGRDDA